MSQVKEYIEAKAEGTTDAAFSEWSKGHSAGYAHGYAQMVYESILQGKKVRVVYEGKDDSAN